ncbi:hypothetical protein FACS1894204_09760 [Synergistales bacterium]|nr:hypothetical protein FACS1894204_09760 [Synergistales bacterium]
MNYLMVMPRFVDRVGEWYNFPLGIPYVSASMKKAGLNLYTLNLNNEEGNVEDILRSAINENKIDVLLTGGLSLEYGAIRKIIQATHEIAPRVKIITGGGIITSAPEPAMKALEFADFGVIGEGEITAVELCRTIENNTNPRDVDGIIYRAPDGRFLQTVKRADIEDLDSLPFPDYEGFGFFKIQNMAPSAFGIDDAHTITISTSRSCPFQCTFCFHPSGVKYRQRSLDSVFEELDHLYKTYDLKCVYISDELFAYNMERVKEFCNRIKPYNIKWVAQFRVPDVTEELVTLLKDSNCVTMGFGLESADNGILKSMRKNTTIEQIERALKLVYDTGLAIIGCFIFGDVAETIDTVKRTLKWWQEHTEYNIALNFIITFPGTPLYRYALEHGIIRDEVQFIKDGCPTVNVSRMSEDERKWLAEMVVSLPLINTKTPKNVGNVMVDYANASVTIDGECVKCDAPNHWDGVRLFTRNFMPCHKCGYKHKVPVPEEVKQVINDNIESLCKEYGSMAFWSINDYFANLALELGVLTSEDIYFVDISSMKQGSELVGKLIQSPKIIELKNIPVVVIPAISMFTMIKTDIEENFPCVRKVLSIADLVSKSV